MPTLTLSHGALASSSPAPLSVDGLLAQGPNLSHWPGNRTPARWKADLSTGICLNYARASESEQREFLGEATVVANDHYDTDGFLSLLAVLRPEVALPREEVCLAAAGTGDFQTLITRRGFAIDRIVARLAKRESPVAAEFGGLSGAHKDLARYRWLLDHAEQVLDEPERWAALWEAEWNSAYDQLLRCRAGAARRQVIHRSALAVVEGPDMDDGVALHRTALNTFAGSYRVLHCVRVKGGTLFRFHYRTETWFEVATFCPPQRVDLSRARDRLEAAEGHRDDGAMWCCDSASQPIPELYFGLPSEQEYGAVSRQLLPSRVTVADVAEILADELALPSSPSP